MKRILSLSLFALLAVAPLKLALAQVAISVNFGPPALPVYEQPACPEAGLMWVPGYWAWDADDADYYWVPGTWVPAPEPGYLWTPPWWGWDNGAYLFHRGYWAPHVGFYGGINYGYGYFGHGYEGGRWDHDHFYYNRAVTNVNVTNVHNVYETRVVNNYYNNHVSYNGGQGGIEARPTQEEEAVARMRHVPPPAQQEQRIQLARANPNFRASANHGRPPVAATERPTDFSGRGVVQARAAGAPWHPPANRPAARGENNARPDAENARPAENNRAPEHASQLPQHQEVPVQGNSAADRRFNQEQQKLAQRQNQDHERLAQQQQKEDQRAQQQHYNQQRQQQLEQRHQNQTQQMMQRHQQQQKQMQQRRPQQARPQQKPEHPPR